jgi:predicted MPP superfamily phosphohydrolase
MRQSRVPSGDRLLHERLGARLGRVHIRQRLSLESEYERHVFRRGTHFFHLENWYSVHGLIRAVLRLAGLHGRGRRNARRLRLVRNEVPLADLPRAFDGYTILQLSDLHLDMGGGFVERLIERVRGLDYDLCVLTGDFRYRTFGPCEPALEAMARLRPHLGRKVYAVLGNHDSLRMVPPLEDMGVRVLLNESVALKRRGAAVYLAGIDDAHFFRADNLHKAAHDIPHDAVSILLSHTPEAWRNAAHAGFQFMLCGHTHGGQICLPGGIPVMIDADCPRRYARGAWRYRDLVGYTSVGAGSSIVDVRLNNRPEVTLHVLRASQ